MDCLEQLMTYDPSVDPFIQAYHAWNAGDSIPETREELLPEEMLQDNNNPFDVSNLTHTYVRRYAFIDRFGFCIPMPALIQFLVSNGPVLEVGAGQGFIARLVQQQGGDIRATDIDPAARHVEKISAEAAILEDKGKSLILSSWPSLNGDWFGEALHGMKSGQKVLYIGEGNGGATASETFFDQIGDTLIPLSLPEGHGFNYRFQGIHDTARLFERR
jgi:SAM-dependent methyltransferase